MTCIKTGCVVYLQPYGEWLYGDAFTYGAGSGDPEHSGVLIVRVCHTTDKIADLEEFGSVRHFTVSCYSDWWDERKTSQAQNSTLIVQPGSWINHGYEGIPEPRLERTIVDV